MSNKDTQLLNHFDDSRRRRDRSDDLRNVPLVRVRVDCATSGLVECGYVFPLGVSEAVIYKDELAGLESMVEKDLSEIKTANDYVNEEADEFKAIGKSDDLRDYPNWPSTFKRRMRREPKPFRSIEVLEELDAPKSQEEKKMGMSLDVLINALKALLPQGVPQGIPQATPTKSNK